MSDIFPAPEAEKLGTERIGKYHPHLAEAYILYLFTTARRTRQSKVVLGSAQKLSDLQRFLSSGNAQDASEGADFIILLSQGEWKDLNEGQRNALVDHELLHCQRNGHDDDGSPIWGLRGHDVEAFAEEIRRHGLWKEDVREFAESVKQLALPEVNSTKMENDL